MQRVRNARVRRPGFSLLCHYHQLETHDTLHGVRRLIVREQVIALLHDLRDMRWPDGLPHKIDYVLVGGEYVSKPQMADGETARSVPNHKLSAEYWSLMNELFDLLNEHFIPTVPPSEAETVELVKQLLRHPGWEDFDWKGCTNAEFAIYIVRTGLKYFHLPMVQCKKWKEFAKIYCGIVMAA